MKAAALILALAIPALAFAQAPAPSTAPPPAQRTVEVIDAWARANLKADGFDIVDRDQQTVTLLRLAQMQDMAPTTVRGWVREEHLDPPTGQRAFRSAALLYDFDCAQMRLRPVAADYYAELNRGGAIVETHDDQTPVWTYARSSSVDEYTLAAACIARARRLAAEGPVFAPPEKKP